MVETLQVAGKATDKLVTFVKELLKTWENEEFWAWLAGFWEGEGSLTMHVDRSGKRSVRPLLTVSQADRRPLDYIYERLKVGNVNLYIKKGTQNYIKEENRVIKARKDCWIWEVESKRAVLEILEHMLPHLRFKADKVRHAISVLQDELKKVQWSKWTPSEIAFLKENYGKIATSEIAKFLNRTIYSVQQKAHLLGLKR